MYLSAINVLTDPNYGEVREGYGSPFYALVSQMPTLGNVSDPFENLNDTVSKDFPSILTHDYYKGVTSSNITVEMRRIDRTTRYSYTFPAGEIANVVIDISHVSRDLNSDEAVVVYERGSIDVQPPYYTAKGAYDIHLEDRAFFGARIYICGKFLNGSPIFKLFRSNDTTTESHSNK